MEGHETLCTERWRELRDGVQSMRTAQTTNHQDNQERLREIEDTLTSVKGGWKVIAGAAAAGGVIVSAAIKILPWFFR